MDPTPRRAARILLVDGADRLLMFHGFDPARPADRYWFTAGGGLEPDEPAAEGAARELAEETGLRMTAEQLGPPVWHEVTEYPFGGRWYRQEQEFFLVRVPEWEVTTDGFDQVERDSIVGHRWWTIDELAATTERLYPDDLAGLLRRVLGVDEVRAGGVGSAQGRVDGVGVDEIRPGGVLASGVESGGVGADGARPGRGSAPC